MKKQLCVLLTTLCLTSPLTWACSYDGQFSNPFSESYPGAFDIAVATANAINAQQLQKPDVLAGDAALRRASWWLSLLGKQLESEQYILLVDSQLWSYFEPSKALVSVHSQLPQAGDQVLMLSESALAAIASQQLSLAQAQQLGLLRYQQHQG